MESKIYYAFNITQDGDIGLGQNRENRFGKQPN